MYSQIKALIFDMDGTLVDSERAHWQAWSETLKAYGMTVPDFQDFSRYVGVSDEQMADEFIDTGDLEISRVQLVARKCSIYLGLLPLIRLLPGVESVLKRYQGRYLMAVASSSPRPELVAILEHRALTGYFEFVVGGDMVKRKKPDPEIYHLAVSGLSLAPADCVAFEDSQSGIAAAKSAGLTAVAVPHDMSADHDFSRADAVILSLAEVSDDLLKNLVREPR